MIISMVIVHVICSWCIVAMVVLLTTFSVGEIAVIPLSVMITQSVLYCRKVQTLEWTTGLMVFTHAVIG